MPNDVHGSVAPGAPGAGTGGGAFKEVVTPMNEERLRLLVTEESRTWTEIDPVLTFGRAHREILRAAETNGADLIVMGAQGRVGVGLALFGSTTQQVVRGATCPVLTVRGPRLS